MGRGKGKAEGPAFKCLFFLILPLWGSSPCPIPSLHLSQFCVTAPSMLSCHCPFSLPLTLNIGTGCDLMAGPRRAASSEGPEETERRAGGRVSAIPNLCVTAGCILFPSSHITTRGPSPQGPPPGSHRAQMGEETMDPESKELGSAFYSVALTESLSLLSQMENEDVTTHRTSVESKES